MFEINKILLDNNIKLFSTFIAPFNLKKANKFDIFVLLYVAWDTNLLLHWQKNVQIILD